MTKKELIYQAVRDGAATYKQAADAVGCHDTYAFEVITDNPEMMRLMGENKHARKVRFCRSVVAKVDAVKDDCAKWFNVQQRTGITNAKYNRCRRWLESTGQSC